MLTALVMAVSIGTSSCHDFGSVDNAARAALDESRSLGSSEYGGVVFEYDGKICYSSPATDSEGLSVTYMVMLVPGSVPVALYHTHPPKAGGFSAIDVFASCSRMIPSYVFSPNSGYFRFVPNAKRCQRREIRQQLGTPLNSWGR